MTATTQKADPGDPRRAVRSYLTKGWRPIPIPWGQKAPTVNDWPNLRIEPQEIDRHFIPPSNAGVLLGEPSKNLVDIDIDAAGVVDLAKMFMPVTSRIFGRAGKPYSHWLYQTANEAKTEKFKHPISGDMIVELRSTGCQTVFPPSRHPTGEIITWEQHGDVPAISADELRAACGRFATAALVRRHLADREAEILEQAAETWAAELGKVDPQLERGARKWLGLPSRNRRANREDGPRFAPADRNHPYVVAAIDNEIAALRRAGKGGRNDALNSCAFGLARWIESGAITEREIETTLLGIAREIGLVADDGEEAAIKTIRSGIRGGKEAEPREIPESARHRASGNGAAQERSAEIEREQPAPEDGGDAARPAPEEEPAAEPADPGPPVVKIRKGELPRMVDEAEAALVAADAGLYRHGGRIVRVILDKVATSRGPVLMLRLMQVLPAHLLEVFAKVSCFAKYDGRSRCWVAADCPDIVAAAYLARGEWRLPALLGVVTSPTIRPDGTVLDQPGYDPATCLLFDPRGVAFPPIPAKPTREEALAALEALKEPIRAFPFVADADRSVALSGILTAVARRALPVVPLHAYTSPVAGSGKSMVTDVAAIIATGHRAAVTATGRDKYGLAELEKRLIASVLAGDAVISLDNLDEALGGEFLCQMITQQVLKPRVLGKSLNVEVPSTAMMFANGNNLVLLGDLTRRALMSTIDPRCERPELREFAFDPLEVAEAGRGRYVAAAITVLRAYEVAGRPKQGSPPLGGFEEWSSRVRDALLWLGAADPVGTMEKVRRGDPLLGKLAAVMTAWEAALGNKRVLTRDVIARAEERHVNGELVNPGLREALLAVALGKSGGISPDRLGWWLRKNAERVINGRRFIQDEDRQKVSTWVLETLPGAQDQPDLGERWET